MSSENELLTRNEAAKIFQVSVDTIKKWEKRGTLHPVRIPLSNTVRLRRSEITALIEKSAEPQAPAPSVAQQ
jgi:excisionase family DNA binding protein